MSAGLTGVWDDVVLVDGMRTPFVDYTGPLGLVSATDLGIKAGRAAIRSRHARRRAESGAG